MQVTVTVGRFRADRHGVRNKARAGGGIAAAVASTQIQHITIAKYPPPGAFELRSPARPTASLILFRRGWCL